MAGNYQDLVTMSPVPHLKSDDIKGIFFKVLKNLTELGFVVVSVTTDGHRTNQSFHNSLGTEGEHPEFIVNPFSPSKNARVYTMYDTVHLFKNIYFNLLNKKSLLCPSFQECGPSLHVHHSHLVQLHNIEYGNEAKMAYKLTDRVLHPSSIERSNVQLAISAMHETTIAALEYYGGKDEHKAFKDTAEFLKLVRKWFDVVNVKSPFIHKRLNDSTRKPVTRDCKDGLTYLQGFESMINRWIERDGRGNKISTDTLKGISYTCRSLIGLANYLLEEHGDMVDHVLLGKNQSDGIEGHFGHLRKLAGGNYWASVRQFMEGEAVIRAKNLVSLSGFYPREVASLMKEAKELRRIDDNRVIDKLVEAASQTDDSIVNEGTEQAMHHVAGYLARTTMNIHKCQSCQDLLVNREASQSSFVNNSEEIAEETNSKSTFSFTDYLNRGNLLVPSEMALSASKDICHTYRSLVKNNETKYALFGCSNPREAFSNVMINIMKDNEDFNNLTCLNGHLFLEQTFKTMTRSLFNVFTSNYVREISSEIHQHKATKSNFLLVLVVRINAK